ncbi:tetratricopeptide repeat-containing sensor histidine kinase [Pontibacter rugosus]|uniref:histidine kinase n=1 Tax=Pontibacter rugosus TaxID=1745966 RepID=A0ABW3SU81_9BACT
MKLNDKKGIALAYNNIGVAHDMYGDYSKASNYYFKSLRIREAIGDSAGISASYNNLASIYATQSNFEKSIELYKKSMDIARAMHDTPSVAMALGNLGSVYQQQRNLDKALDYIQRGLELEKNNNDLNGMLISLNNIGLIYSEKGEWEKALTYHNKALKIARESGNTVDEAYSLNAMAEAYMAGKRSDLALPYALENLQLVQKLNSKDEITIAAEQLNHLYLNLDDYKSAHKYLTLQNQYEDSVQLDELQHHMGELQLKYEKEKAVQENLLLKAEAELQQQALQRRNALQMLTVAALLTVCVVAIGFFKGRQRLRRINGLLLQGNADIQRHSDMLTRQKEQLAAQASLLQSQKEELEKLNAVKDRLFSVIAHDLKGPLVSLKGLLQIAAKGSVPEDKMRVFMASLEASQQNSLWLLDNLLLWAKAQMQGLLVRPETLEVQELVSQNLLLLQPQAEQKKVTLSCHLEQELHLHADREMVSLVVRNLISNAIKFCKRGDSIVISGWSESGFTAISVQDTGIGMAPERLEGLFSGSNTSSRGTANEKGSGLGLHLCKYFVEQNGGSIGASSSPGQGSTFTFSLPAADTLVKTKKQKLLVIA